MVVKRNNCRRQECLEGTFEDTKQYLEAVNQRWTYVYKYHGQKKKAKKTNNDLHHTTQKTKD
jgi:ABC-type enterochelin transport system substrate-binding protein